MKRAQLQRGETLARAKPKLARGNRLYALSYAFTSMKSFPFRSLSLAITLSLGVSLVGSVLIWGDTGIQVSVSNYFDQNAFQMLVEGPNVDSAALTQAEQYLQQSSYIDSTYSLNSTIGLVYGSELPDDTLYGLDEPIYSAGMKDCQVIFVNNEFLDIAERDFNVEGRFTLQPGEALVSVQFIDYVHDVFGMVLTLNSTFDVELLTKAPTAQVGAIGDLGRISVKDLTIAGIYEIKGYGSLEEEGFPSLMRSNYDYVTYDTPVLGIRDSIMIRSDSVDLSTITDNGFFDKQVFVRGSATGLVSAGPDQMADHLLTLKSRLEQEYAVEVKGLYEILYLQGIVDTYVNTMPLISLNMPLFILALFLSVFAADTFMSARTGEVSALRSKGASSSQIYAIFITEAIVMAIVSVILGILLSIVFSALIPSAVSFLKFNWDTYNFYLAHTVIKPEAIIYSILFCIVPPLLFIINSARKATRAEIGMLMVESAEPVSDQGEARGFTLGISIVLLSMVVGSAIFLPADPMLLTLELGLGTAAWFFLAHNASHVFRRAFARLTAKISFILGEKGQIAAGNLRMRKGRIVPLMVILALTLSSTVAFSVQAETYRVDLQQEISYAVGADLRVSSTSMPLTFNETIESYPGVNDAMAVIQTHGSIGTERISIEAVDPTEYAKIGHFDTSSFNGDDPTEVLARLVTTPNGILLSQYHADRWNKTVGDSITLFVSGRLAGSDVTFKIVGIVHSAPGFGYASAEDIPSSRVGAAFGFQAKLAGFAITNINYISEQTGITTARLFLADLVCITDQDLLLRALNDLPGVSATTPEKFDLSHQSFATALFLSTVEGLFSIGFAMSMLLSVFSLTLFLGSIVRERKRDYAILRAVGASKGQVIRTVLSEFTGIVLASLTLSLVLGAIFGFVMSVIVFAMSPFARLLAPVMVFPIGFLTLVIGFELILMVIGSYIPAREASKTDPAIVLRNL
ncbi:MAG: FtsX-like permease family protein [Candidatus Thorarchaeota archaeon]|nr:FtsX-like permease family protein [Candidatus Thorarchaeota archaeon]